jgi:hypothetical protein
MNFAAKASLFVLLIPAAASGAVNIFDVYQQASAGAGVHVLGIDGDTGQPRTYSANDGQTSPTAAVASARQGGVSAASSAALTYAATDSSDGKSKILSFTGQANSQVSLIGAEPFADTSGGVRVEVSFSTDVPVRFTISGDGQFQVAARGASGNLDAAFTVYVQTSSGQVVLSDANLRSATNTDSYSKILSGSQTAPAGTYRAIFTVGTHNLTVTPNDSTILGSQSNAMITISPVPEPATLGALASGLLFLSRRNALRGPVTSG